MNINNKLYFNLTNLTNFKNFINFNSYPVKTLSKSSFYFNEKVIKVILEEKSNIYPKSKFKIFKTKLKLWIEDFYISGKDFYSNKSSTMIKCSKTYRFDSFNFRTF